MIEASIYGIHMDLGDELTKDFIDLEYIEPKSYEKRTHATRKFLDGGVRNHMGKLVNMDFYQVKGGRRLEIQLSGILQRVDFQGVTLVLQEARQVNGDGSTIELPISSEPTPYPYLYQRSDYKSDQRDMGITSLSLATDGTNLVPNL